MISKVNNQGENNYSFGIRWTDGGKTLYTIFVILQIIFYVLMIIGWIFIYSPL